MKKRIFFDVPEELIIFKDSKSDVNCFAMTKETLIEKIKIVEKFGKHETDVPDEYTIKVNPIRFYKQKDQYTDIYRPSLSELIEFPINRIEWIWIQISTR